MVVAVECLFTWDWLADLGAHAGLPLVRGHARSMQAIQGGKAKNDTIDAPKMAVLLRGGRLPQASVSPAAMRAPRARRRRRMSLTRRRAEVLAHLQNTNSPYPLPASGKKLADKANRAGGAERWPEFAVQQSLEVDLARRGSYAPRRRALELPIVQAAQQHAPPTLSWLQTVPGMGKIRSLVLLYESHDIQRFPRVQAFVSSWRLVTCAKAAAGKRYGPAGAKSGNAYLQWAFSEAAGLFRRDNPAGQQSLPRLEKKHGQGTALTLLAQKRGRAVSYR